MLVEFRCAKCQANIKNVSVCVDSVSFRSDLVTTPTLKKGSTNMYPFLVEYDREYFSGFVKCITYNCICGTIQITREECPSINDFLIREGRSLSGDRFKDSYSSLLVVKTY